jgi:hypothetical protein
VLNGSDGMGASAAGNLVVICRTGALPALPATARSILASSRTEGDGRGPTEVLGAVPADPAPVAAITAMAAAAAVPAAIAALS